ncbi:GNAT family N-acetyltransferase [Sandaracinobacteroides saxicola]|uniref:GNAT family N-acetyltransferase n=1 Tax=Sandaracinobacteroides saxicola TaxID=2759707 RepID=A0A7G5IHS5_9SPHN|nr:GNAT family N-acetyltransferase [Sandaracinobacteroides saxicola]QMW22917.1 GNAT family N-acetyltransferase [Sandaracinobacteroides saxicola]
MIRLGTRADFAALAAVERSAALSFAGTPMAFVIGHGTTPDDALCAGVAEKSLWVSDLAGEPAGFLLAAAEGEWLHILELSVAQAAQRRGIGRALVERAAEHARARGLRSLSLTTDRFIEWNAPAYARMGFAELAAGEQPDWLAGILLREATHGLDPARRVAMARGV